ncbi:MAG: ABC transporter ATP-binding protein/permease [Lachnospiraceae bacterium]|nr:ABC transporter ATP-binding protein/permease [Lachnospiraceae bacterium]
MIFGKYINRYYLKNAPLLLLGIAALVLVDYFQLLVPEMYRIVVNGMNDGQAVIDGTMTEFTLDVLLDEVCLPMIFIVIAMVIGRFLWRVCFFGSAIRVETDLRCRMFEHSKDLSQEYYQKNKVGSLMSLFTNDLDTIQECFGDGVLMFFDALVLGGLAFVKMLRMDLLLTCLALVPLLILLVLGLTMSRMLEKSWEARQAVFSELSDFTQETFSGIAVVKAFVKEFQELQAFCKLNKQNEDANVSYTRISTLLDVLITLFVESVVCVILGYGGWLVYNRQFDAGMLIEYVGYFTSIVWPFMAVAMLIEKSSRGKASLNRISELLDAKVDVKDKTPRPQWGTGQASGGEPSVVQENTAFRAADNDYGIVTDLDEVKGKIEFRHLSFRYPAGENHNINVKLSENDTSASNPDANSTDINIACARVPFTAEDCSVSGEAKEVLHDVSFTIEAGESVGIVGHTGAGKTTLVDLILRVWNVEDGTLFVDDRDVNTISIHSLRDGCAYVPQDNFLFSDTIANNIAFAVDKNPSGGLQRRIRQAAIAADVDEDISGFKEGYETVLGERGVTVSGGQKQRISIARALMKDAPILILDDSVSAVDTGTERVILDHLKERGGKTTILIAHRISTVEEMDKIIFLEDGCVKAVGPHKELYETCKEYRKMVDLQKLEEEVKQ